MKTNFNNSWRKSLFFAFLILTSITLYNCSNDDDNPAPGPTGEEVDKEFSEGVEELPELEDEDLEVTEPDVEAEVSTPEATTTAAADFKAATSTDDLSAESKAIFNSLQTTRTNVPESAKTTATGLTEEQIAMMLDIDQDLPANVEADVDAIVAAIPADIMALLPKITFDFGTSAAASVSGKEGVQVLNAGVELDPVAQAVDAPCEDLYRDAYDEIIATRQQTRDDQLATILANFNRRMEAAGTRLTTRIAEIDGDADAFAAEVEIVADEFLAAAEGLGVAEEELKLMAFLVALEGRKQIMTWYEAAETVINAAKTTEEAAIQARKDDKEASVNASYQEAKSDADAILSAGLANCHNQGSGS